MFWLLVIAAPTVSLSVEMNWHDCSQYRLSARAAEATHLGGKPVRTKPLARRPLRVLCSTRHAERSHF